MTDVDELVKEATAKIRSEADSLRREIEEIVRAADEQLAPKRLALEQLEAALSRIEGRGTNATPRTRARRGENVERIEAFLAATPHATAPDIAKGTDIPSPSVYAALNKMVERGTLRKEAEGSYVLARKPRK
jgi:sugar-specific transcriptional regulator TrmB